MAGEGSVRPVRRAAKRSHPAGGNPVGRQPAEGGDRPLAEIAEKLLILEEPTAGVDVGAKAEIYALLNAALERGLAILVIATDFEEVANICHRALVFSRGEVVDELNCDQLSVEAILHAASAGIENRPIVWSRTHELDPVDRAGADTRRVARSDVRPADRAADAGLRAGDPDRPAHPAVLAAAARDVSDPAQPALDPERQVADRAAVARRNDPDDDRQDRPDGRLRHRALAHPRDHAADPCRTALAGGGRAGDPGRGRVRLVQRLPGRGRAHRQLHRHAGHRHRDLRGGTLVHGRPADDRQPAALASSW